MQYPQVDWTTDNAMPSSWIPFSVFFLLFIECVCRAYCIQYDDIAWHKHADCPMQYLCSFVTTYKVVLEAVERFMVRWHEYEAQPGRQLRASAVGGAQGNGQRGGNRRSRRETAVDESRKETADKVEKHQTD